MTDLRTLALAVMTVLVVTARCTSIDAQTTSQASKSALISVCISMDKSVYPVDQKPTVVLTMKNIASRQVCLSTASTVYRVHVDTEGGEAPETEYHRHLRGDYRPGDRSPIPEGPVICSPIVPGSSDTLSFNLTTYYDLSVAGKYSVYLEVQDDSGVWLKTNAMQFEMVAPSQ
jgi:hypothetical protein